MPREVGPVKEAPANGAAEVAGAPKPSDRLRRMPSPQHLCPSGASPTVAVVQG